MNNANTEIERKFLLSALPEIEPYEVAAVTQGYLSIDPEVRVRSHRILNGGGSGLAPYTLSIKGNGTLTRKEIETVISEEVFEAVTEFIGHPLIHKTYYQYMHEGRVVEVSEVDVGLPHAFVYAEVEFKTEEEATAYEWPFGGLIRDVTYDPLFKMKNYWRDTRLNKRYAHKQTLESAT
jgi:CYTH domain-containing protein